MGEQNQAAQRRYETKMDQHGRLWGGSIEIKSGHWTGLIDYLEPGQPDTKFPFRPPLLPPQQYVRPVLNRPYDCQVAYSAWLGEARVNLRLWRRRAMEEGLRLHQDKYDPTAPVAPQVISIIGREPLRPELIIACRDGNPWMLGAVATPDVRLMRFFPPPPPEHDGADEDGINWGVLVTAEKKVTGSSVPTLPAADPDKAFVCDFPGCRAAFGTERSLQGHRRGKGHSLAAQTQEADEELLAAGVL